MIYSLIIFLVLFGISKGGELKSAYMSKDIEIELDGKKKIKSYSSDILIQDDIGESDFRHFYIFLPYDGKIKNVELSVIRDGSIIREQYLKDAEKRINREAYTLASDHYYYYWDLGSLDPGDIIRRRYRIELKDASYGDYEPVLSSIPVEKASVRIKYRADDWSLRYCVDNGEVLIDEDRAELEFYWESLPGRDDSDFEKAPLDLLPGIWYLFESKKGKKDFSDWNGVYEWQVDLCRGTSLSEKDSHLLDIADTPEEIFSRVISECRYVAVEIDEGRFKPMPASKVWDQGYGDCKALANLFVGWLNLAGYEAWPVLVRSRNSFMGNFDFPSPFVFDHEIAAFISDNGDTVYQDLTAESIPFGDLPIGHYGDFALPLRENTYPVRLPYSPREPDTIRFSITGVIDSSYGLGGQVVCRRTGQGAVREIWNARNIHKGTDRNTVVKAYFESAMKGAVFDKFEESFPGDTLIIRTAEVKKRNLGFKKDGLLILKPWIVDYLKYDAEPDSNRTWPTILRRNIVYETEYRCKIDGIVLGDFIEDENSFTPEDFEFFFANGSHDDSLIVKASIYLKPRILNPARFNSYFRDRGRISDRLSQGLIFMVE